MNPRTSARPGHRDQSRLAGTGVMVAGLAAAAIVAGVILVVLGTGGDGDGSELDRAAGGGTTEPVGTGEEDDRDGASGAGATDDPNDGGATTTTADGDDDSTNGTTTDTVEADEETTDDPTDGDSEDDRPGAGGSTTTAPGQDADGGEGGPSSTAPTVPPATTGTCRIAVERFDGQAGLLELGTDGSCGALAATIQAVNPRDDLADADWGRDIRVCQRHPAADEVDVTVATGTGTVPLTGGLSRTPEEAGADPIESITVTFDDQETPVTGPRPVALCRTDRAELSIVHRPPR